jgi:starvation-inducible DNA-binding protein
MEQLQEILKRVLANTFTMYMKAHGYHWNVIGPDFPQLHDFFGDLYSELHGAVDPTAEQIRAIDGFAQGTLARMIELSTVTEDENIPNATAMLNNLLAANQTVLDSLMECNAAAEQLNETGLANFLQGRIEIHKKHGWMLKATLGKKA